MKKMEDLKKIREEIRKKDMEIRDREDTLCRCEELMRREAEGKEEAKRKERKRSKMLTRRQPNISPKERQTIEVCPHVERESGCRGGVIG